MLSTLQARYYRRRADREYQKTTSKNDNSDQPNGLILTVSIYLSLPARNASLNLEKVNKIILLVITEPSDIFSFAIIQDTTSLGTILNTVRREINLTLSRPRRTWIYVYINMIMLSISSAILIRK